MNIYKEIIVSFLDTLDRHGFSKTIDSAGNYLTNADLYYKQINEYQYIVFNHFNKKRRADLQGFDCWIATYYYGNDVGKTKASKIECVRLCFNIERDWGLIEKYLMSEFSEVITNQ